MFTSGWTWPCYISGALVHGGATHEIAVYVYLVGSIERSSEVPNAGRAKPMVRRRRWSRALGTGRGAVQVHGEPIAEGATKFGDLGWPLL